MPYLTLGWEYLTGYSVATYPTNRKRTEWPPHPGRVFLAMAAAYFETGEDPAEGDALRWLETLDKPNLYLPLGDQVFERSIVKVYVPVNDVPIGDKPGILQCVPGWPRSKKERFFPRIWVDHTPCFMHWPDAKGVDDHNNALNRLCSKVTRIGHPSSLVRMWVAEDREMRVGERWEPDDVRATDHFRVVTPGTLDTLPGQTQIPRIEEFADIRLRIEDAEYQKAEAKQNQDKAGQKVANKKLKRAKAEYERRFGEKWTKRASPPSLLRPKLGLWSGYRRVDQYETIGEVQHSHFDTDVLVLTHVDGPRLPGASTLAVTQALRGAVLKRAHDQFCSCDRWKEGVPPPTEAAECYARIPAWVSGHRSRGGRCENESGHLAFIPFPFVGHEHADGHLLGVGMVFPRSVDRRERGKVLGKLLLHKNGQPRDVKLTLGQLGVWTVRKREWNERRETLNPEMWTAHPDGSTTWMSVTPMVLDKFPKADRTKDRDGWMREVTGIIIEACDRIDLPEPVSIDIDATCWHRGSPRAITKKRPVRGHVILKQSKDATLGDGFPFYPAKGTKAPRPQVHIWLRFAEPVVGPLLLGAGRYRGYGLCKPWREARR